MSKYKKDRSACAGRRLRFLP